MCIHAWYIFYSIYFLHNSTHSIRRTFIIRYTHARASRVRKTDHACAHSHACTKHYNGHFGRSLGCAERERIQIRIHPLTPMRMQVSNITHIDCPRRIESRLSHLTSTNKFNKVNALRTANGNSSACRTCAYANMLHIVLCMLTSTAHLMHFLFGITMPDADETAAR